MSEKLRESLSALMDDEANELELQRVLSLIGQDSELRETWVRYNATRSALSGQQVAGLNLDISSRVSAAIASDGELGSGAQRAVQRLMKPLASMAVAASVMGAVVFGGQQLAYLDSSSAGNQAVAASASPVGLVNSLGATTVQASYGTQTMPGLEPATRTAYKELARQRMQKYMQEHVEHAALNSPQGLLPFARVPRIEE
jgi:sigma-E factor negative regulatory protein RseA